MESASKVLKKVIRAFTPPIVPNSFKKIHSLLSKNGSEALFDGDDALFKKTFVKDSVYAEYGCGASTLWVAKNIGCEIFSVDSSIEWIDRVKRQCESFTKVTLHLADVGPVGAWGTPLGYEKAENFTDYTDWIWSNKKRPTVVLVDGRFRVCCFLTCLIKGERGTKILFDDYTNRPHYHFVEKYVKPIETCGRQALFVIPERELLDINDIKDSIHKFRFVFD